MLLLRWLQFVGRWTVRLGLVMAVAVVLSAVSATITLKVLTARHQVQVPNLKGMTLEAAMKAAEDLQLRVQVQKPGIFSETVPPQHVAMQNPEPGVAVKPGRTIVVALSLGSERVVVPDLHGDSLRAAQLKLKKIGLEPGTVLFVRKPGLDEGVIYQQPKAGETARQGERVVMVLNQLQRSNYIMPDVVGLPADRVIAFFRRHGYRIGHIMYQVYVGVAPGIVIGQTPAAGFPLQQHDVISLVVSRLP